MSAWLCSRAHIATLAQYAADARIGEWNLYRGRETPALDIANDLLRENMVSLDARYPDQWRQDWAEDKIAPFADENEVMQWAQPQYFTPGAIANAAHCLRYQSCENDGWQESKAAKLLDALVDYCARQLPGYEVTPWGIEGERSNVIRLSSLVPKRKPEQRT